MLLKSGSGWRAARAGARLLARVAQQRVIAVPDLACRNGRRPVTKTFAPTRIRRAQRHTKSMQHGSHEGHSEAAAQTAILRITRPCPPTETRVVDPGAGAGIDGSWQSISSESRCAHHERETRDSVAQSPQRRSTAGDRWWPQRVGLPSRSTGPPGEQVSGYSASFTSCVCCLTRACRYQTALGVARISSAIRCSDARGRPRLQLARFASD